MLLKGINQAYQFDKIIRNYHIINIDLNIFLCIITIYFVYNIYEQKQRNNN